MIQPVFEQSTKHKEPATQLAICVSCQLPTDDSLLFDDSVFPDPPIAFREFAMAERLPLATIHGAVLEFLRGRSDVAIFGAQAVNAYVDNPRMTQDVDILSTCGAALSEELCEHLHQRFHIAVRVLTNRFNEEQRTKHQELAFYRIYQVRTPTNRHLVDVRQIESLPACERIEGILVVSPAELLSMKVISMAARPKTPKGLTDEVDLLRLLLTFPNLKSASGSVTETLHRVNASDDALRAWQDLVARDIRPEEDEEY